MQKRSSKKAASPNPSGVGNAAVALETLRTLRADGFAVTRVAVGSVMLELAATPETFAPGATVPPRPRRSIVQEYGGPGIAKMLEGDAEPDENGMVPA